MDKESVFKNERKRLKETIILAERELEEEKEIYKNLEKTTTDEYLLAELQKKYVTKIKNLEKALKVPYFARVDFKEKHHDEKQKIYIGKTNVFDEDYNVIVADWRAPISTIYYDSEIGDTQYECPEGIIEGELSLKRQYRIEDAQLIDYNDVNITTNDELLQECLKENSDVRLKNIVSTIQKEQNQIIRANMFKPLIVQGVAGSGKTTVAIHRIAYLIYTYDKSFKPEEFLIIAPNKFFLGYIKNSLPDLGVDYVRQETFEELALKIINDKIKAEDSNNNLIKIVENKLNANQKNVLIGNCKFKGSLKFKDAIDEYLKMVNLNILEKEDFCISGIRVISYQKLQEILMDNYERYPLKTRIDKLQAYIKHQLENNFEIIIDKITEVRKAKIERIDKTLSKEEQDKKRIEIFEEYEEDIKSLLRNKGVKIVNTYIKKIKIPTAFNCYCNIINDSTLLDKYTEKEIIDFMREELRLNFKKKIIQYEDLTGILHLQYNLFGMNEKLVLKHIVIDEAQDFSEFQFYTLNEILSNNKSLTILGDIAQGIYGYRGTNNWNEINQKIFKKDANIQYLKQSYRTTSEIMEEANKVISSIRNEEDIILADPIARHGEKVEYIALQNYEDKVMKINERIKEEISKGYNNIAIIGKDSNICEKIYKDLKNKYENIEIISEKTSDYGGGITIVPSYYSKGLEFDSVIIADYNSYYDNTLDKKLLYVALTRAMHSLYILK